MFKFIFKRTGQNTDPCYTPHNNSFHEQKVLLILTFCFRLFRLVKNQVKFFFSKSIGIEFCQ